MTQMLPDEIRAVRDARPEPGGYPAQARTRARALLLDAIEADQRSAGHLLLDAIEADQRSAGHRHGRQAAGLWRGGRRPLLAGAAAVGVAAGAAAGLAIALLPTAAPGRALGPGGPGESAPGTGRAAVVLTAAAATAARQHAAPVPGRGQYLYVSDIFSKGGQGPGARCTSWRDQEWMAADGSGRVVTAPASAGCGKPLTRSWRPGGITRDALPISWPLNLLAWRGLPASPAALERAIVRRYEHDHADAAATFVYAGSLLELDAPPAIRAAVYRVMEKLPGVQALGAATDQLGRHGIAVGLTGHGIRSELIFDPATSRALEYEQVVVAPPQSGNNHLPTGWLFGSDVYVTGGLVHGSTATRPDSGSSGMSS